MTSHTGRLATWLGWLLALAYTLAPFEFTLSHHYSPEADRDVWQMAAHVVVHAAAFAALGILTRLGWPAPDTRPNLRLLIGGGLLACVVVEAAQWLVPGRHPRAVDLLVNSVALTAGMLAAPRIMGGGHGRLPLRRLRPLLFALWAACWVILWFVPSRLVTLDGWDGRYHLMFGNETENPDREGAWDGVLQFAGIYNRALSADDVTRVIASAPTTGEGTADRIRLGALTLYDFGDRRSGAIPARGPIAAEDLWIDIHGSATASATPPGVHLRDGARLVTRGTAAPLITAMAGTGAFSLEVWCRPANITQRGPARLLTISDGLWERNVTLAQEADGLRLRVRNPLNGENGIRFELRAHQVFTGDLVHLVATYDHGVSRVFRNGVPVSPVVDLAQPSVLLGLGASPVAKLVTAGIAGLTLLLIARL